MMSTVTDTGSLIPTLDASNLTYQFERMKVKSSNITDTKQIIERIDRVKKIPYNLEYLDDFRDKATGTSGTAFRDKTTGEIIIAYTGTNPEADIVRDGITDLIDIALEVGGHYSPAYTFYEQIAAKYGAENIMLTGHSLGGNIAQRVALKYNVQNTVVYNPAPLYFDTEPIELSNSARPSTTVQDIEKDMLLFTGKVTRITTQKDFLNNLSDSFFGVYLGTEYILLNSGEHGLDELVNSPEQVAQVYNILYGNNSYLNFNADMIASDSRLRNVDIDGDGIIDVKLSGFDGRPKDLFSDKNTLITSTQLVQVNPQSLRYLAQNLNTRITTDIIEIQKIIRLCISKNKSVSNDFNSRKEKITESIQNVFRETGLLSILHHIHDSIGVIMDNRRLLDEVSVNVQLRNPFDYHQQPLVGGERLDFYRYNQQLAGMRHTCYPLIERLNKEKIYTISSLWLGTPTIMKSWEIVDSATKQLLDSSDELFEGEGLREGKKDGISEAVALVLDVILANTHEITSLLHNVVHLINSLATNFEDADHWIGQQLEKGAFSNTFRSSSMPTTYRAYLDRDEIFDDVKDVLQAFDRQIEKRSLEYAKKVATIYQETLGSFESGLRDFIGFAYNFKDVIKVILDNYDIPVYVREKQITYENIDGELIKNTTENTTYWGTLQNLYPLNIRDVVNQIHHKIVPTFDKIQRVLETSESTKMKLRDVKAQLKPIIEDGVYHAFDLDEIVKGQKMVASIATRLGNEIQHVIDVIAGDGMQALAITTLKQKLSEIHQLIGFYTQFINDCFGDNENSSYVVQSGGGNKHMIFSLN